MAALATESLLGLLSGAIIAAAVACRLNVGCYIFNIAAAVVRSGGRLVRLQWFLDSALLLCYVVASVSVDFWHFTEVLRHFDFGEQNLLQILEGNHDHSDIIQSFFIKRQADDIINCLPRLFVNILQLLGSAGVPDIFHDLFAGQSIINAIA